MAGVDEASLRAAVAKRRSHILENLETMSAKTCRQLLEQDLGLEQDALKPFKRLLSQLLDEVIASAAGQEAADEGAEAEAEDDAEEDPQPRKKKQAKDKQQQQQQAAAAKKKKTAAEGGKQRASTENQAQAARAGPKQYGRAVEKLRALCRSATITIPPNIYVKNKEESALRAALEALLDKHGLSADAGPADVQRVKAKLQLQRDLDGIDTTNILEGGRRRRAAAAAVPSYRQRYGSGSEEEGDEDSEEEEEEAGSGSEDEGSGPAASGSGGEEADASEASDGEEEDEPTPDTVVKAKAESGGVKAGGQKRISPDENGGDAGNAKKQRRVVDWSSDDE